ncbi:hypothetical protein [Niallia nealsonii]|uniref:hypothetical protein n=1 Tax=Niallia nealsonii TaxID=115979 RepID=UPI001F1CE2DA|nr:hypothetical protein [Niallia nealsonii]
MEDIIKQLNDWIHKVTEDFTNLSESAISKQPEPNKWSKKEVLGHFCDSVIMNLERFIKIQY